MTDTHPRRAAQSSTGIPVIRTDKLSKTFSSQGVQQHVLKNLDLDIYRGDFTVIMGPSGAGKSTLLYALSGMDTPTLGSIWFDDEEISGLSQDRLARFRRRHCGFVFQQINLLDSMSVLDNVLAPGLLVNRRRDQVTARAKELFELVGLPPATLGKFPSMLSGGEAQRVGIVRAMINEPSVVFADEPTGQLNSENSELVLDLLSQINAQGQSIVMVTHDVRSALRGNRVLYLRDGLIRGELEVGRFSATAVEPRHARLTAFLAEMGW